MKKPDKSLIDEIIPFNGMKVLEIDIETKPNRGWFFETRKAFISDDMIEDPIAILCWDARWQHETKHIFRSLRKHGREKMMEDLWLLLDEADVVVHYNGKRFDIPHINREFLELEFTPPSPYQQIDLYQVVRTQFKFVRNTFDHIVDRLFGERKLETQGFRLWRDCCEGVAKAWKIMEDYNKHDTALLRPTYLRLQPWIKQHPNRGLYIADGSKPVCPTCGNTETLRIKAYRPAEPGINTHKTRVNCFPQYHCDPDRFDENTGKHGCGAYARGRIAIKRDRSHILT
jgi:hypothetical protein